MTKRRRWLAVLVTLGGIAVLIVVYVLTHPLVFMAAHQHCIKFAGLQLLQYADEHEGRFPFHPDGYGNALLLLDEDCFHSLTGPGYEAQPLLEAKKTNRQLSEDECGRVYVQGLTRKSNPEIALLFDKLPTPGGDHCHLPIRLWTPLGREVWLVAGHSTFVLESEWPEFTKKQVDLLAKEGFDRDEAERLFASKPK